ncbi:MAG: energy transducer TonB [Pseudolabrys sp.]
MIAVVEDRNDLPRWLLSAVVVIGIHAALAVTLTRWHEPLAGDEGTEAIVVDLAPFTAPPTESRNDLAPGPERQQSTAPPDAQPLKPEENQEKIELPPPVPDADVQLPAEPVKPPNKQIEQPSPPAVETSPPRPRPTTAQIASWHRRIAQQVERNKGYPALARARHETGTAELAFTINRNGMVTASRVVRTSGFASLDQETIDTVRRAQPFPPPPPNMPGDTFEFTVPIRFNIR